LVAILVSGVMIRTPCRSILDNFSIVDFEH
jgi:hypothetical protein